MSLKRLLEQASKAYYEGKPIMPDYQFDEIAKLHEWKKIGYGGTDDRIKHKYKIYSLQKFFTDSDKWVWYFEMLYLWRVLGIVVLFKYCTVYVLYRVFANS